MDKLTQALREAAEDILKGDPALQVIAETADLHGIKPELFNRKFAESFGPPETLRERRGAGYEAARAKHLSDAETDRWFTNELAKMGFKQ